jgi:nucleotide-binding universal stress UspA family protein
MSTPKVQRILVPTDFSDNSLVAMDYACWLAQVLKAEVSILHVAEPHVYPAAFGLGSVNLPELEQKLRAAAVERVDRLKSEKVPAGVAARAAVVDGVPFVEIVRRARDEKADLIVIATHGYSGLKHVLLGSTAERVVRKAPCPVLTVRHGQQAFTLP